MARYWLGTTSDDPTNVLNWGTASGVGAGASVPTSADDVTFDGGGNNACTFVGSMNFGSLSVAAGYMAKLDLGDVAATLTITDGGDIILDNGGEFDCGDATISLTNGNFDNQHVVTYTSDTSTLVMAGTGTLISSGSNFLFNLTILAGAVTTITETMSTAGIVSVNGTLSISVGKSFFSSLVSTTTLGALGKITGDGEYLISNPGAGEGITSFASGGIIDIAKLTIQNPRATAIFVAQTYQPTLLKIYCVDAAARVLTFNGNYTFTGDLEFENTNAGGSLTIANDTNNPTIIVRGDVIWDQQAGTITYTKGTNPMTASGLGDQNLDFDNQASEDLEIDKTTSGDVTLANCDLALVDSELAGALTFASSTIVMEAGSTLMASGAGSPSWDLDGQTIKALVVNKSGGTLTFTGGWIATVYTQTLGTVDFNGQTLETTGNFTIAVGALIASGTDTMNGVALTVGGDFSVAGIDGTLLNLRGTSAWTLDVAGRATATYVDVSYSNATAGSTVFAQGSTNNSNNSRWSFMVPRSITIGTDDDAISLARRTEVILAG